MRKASTWVLCSLVCVSGVRLGGASADEHASATTQLREEAKKLKSFAASPAVREFLDTRRYYTPADAQGMPQEERAALEELVFDDHYYYTTRYGSPLAYCRALDLVARTGVTSFAGKRVLDFGYGTIGHLRLLASLGAEVVGIEVNPLYPKLYSDPMDQGSIAGIAGRSGSIQLLHGRYPAVPELRSQVGDGYDLFLSKNTLKRGYIHPERAVDERMTIQLGVDDSTYVQAVFEALKPGGFFLIYNLAPAPAPPDQPYIPWADGRCPFARELLEAAGFQILAYDVDDSVAAREMGRRLGWAEGENAMDLEKDLFGTYMLARKPGRPPSP
jgi:SAM-dependent methyltransferase